MKDIFAPLDEKLYILDENKNKIAESKMYEEIHREGILHLCVHVWVLNSEKQLLLQKRSKYVRVYPEYWDNSASGHVMFDQTSLEAAQKETREELGLDLSPEFFKYLFSIREHFTANDGTYIENAFNDVYLVQVDLDIEKLKTESKEITELKWFDLEEFKKLVAGQGEPLTTHHEEYKKLIEYLNENNRN